MQGFRHYDLVLTNAMLSPSGDAELHHGLAQFLNEQGNAVGPSDNLGHPPVHSEDEIQSIRFEPGDLHDLGDTVASEAAEPSSRLNVVERDHGTKYSAIRAAAGPSR